MTALLSRGNLASALLIGSCFGCASEPQPQVGTIDRSQASSAAIRDSVGVRIVDYTRLAPSDPWFISKASFVLDDWSQIGSAFTVDSVAFRDFGGDGATFELKDPLFASAVELPNGVFVVSDKDRLVRVDASGRVLGISGRAGRGPAEFDDIRNVCIFDADTLLVIDKLGTASLWNSHGTHIRTMAEKDPLLWSSCDGDGHVISTTRPRGAKIDPGGNERFAPHWLARPNGDRVAPIGELPASVSAGLLVWQPWVAWSGEELVVARARNFELSWRYPDGRVRQIVRLSRRVERISDAQWQRVLADAIPAGSSSSNRKLVMQVMGPKPEAAFPAHGRIVIDPQRRVWVEDFANPSSLTVFAYDGSLMGRIQLRSIPGSIRPALVSAGVNHIQVREQDADGFIHLRFYRLHDRH